MSSKIFNYNGINSYLPPEQARPSNPQLLALNAKPTTHTLKQTSFRGGSFLGDLVGFGIKELGLGGALNANKVGGGHLILP